MTENKNELIDINRNIKIIKIELTLNKSYYLKVKKIYKKVCKNNKKLLESKNIFNKKLVCKNN